MAEYLIQDTTLDAIADAINAKTGGSSAMTPAQMVAAIGTISGGGNQITKDEWTLASDLNTTTQGFFYSAYCDRTFNGFQLFHFENNQAADFQAIIAFIDQASVDSSKCGYKYIRSGNTLISGTSAGIEYRVSSGATITRYKMDYQGV